MAGGRPPKYNPHILEQAKKLCRLGALDTDLADFFEVAVSTIYAWKKDHPEFSEVLKQSKAEVDARVERSLLERATGYQHREERVVTINGKNEIVTTTKHYPPDTTACIFWLKNRQREFWRDTHHLGNDPFNPLTETSQMSDADLEKIIQEAEKEEDDEENDG